MEAELGQRFVDWFGKLYELLLDAPLVGGLLKSLTDSVPLDQHWLVALGVVVLFGLVFAHVFRFPSR